MFSGIAADIAHSDRETISEAHDAELRNGVLFEELPHEFLGKSEGQEVSCWPEVFFGHGL
jgi:hypothetical protein